jgi:hypothetical protein
VSEWTGYAYVAYAVVVAEVVVLVEADPVDEEAVQLVPADHLVHDVEYLLLVPLARGTHRHDVSSVHLPRAVGRDVQPLGMLLGDGPLHLGEVHPAQEAETSPRGGIERVLDQITAGTGIG